MIQLIRGFKDILPGEVEVWQHIEETAARLFKDFGFKEIRTPLVERTELFARSIGEDTDIVEKEMYTFPDRKGDLITLRPEATASAVRAYIQHKLYAKDPIRKFYTMGPMFRRERPQKGRYRQFYQINAEVFGIASPLVDAQLIYILVELFNRLAVEDTNVHINSLGCKKCRPNFKTALFDYISSKTTTLCSNCERRVHRNPLRVLDCKVPACRETMDDAPLLSDFLCNDCSDHFSLVNETLKKLKIEFIIDNHLVRGLDYYTRTTFEIQTGSLGAQNAVAGGGRYDGLVQTLGGPDEPAIGFAIGFDRLAEITKLDKNTFIQKPDIFIAALGEKSRDIAFEWTVKLSLIGVKAEMEFNDKSLKSQMRRANRLEASHVLIVGEKELENGEVVLRNMATKNQTFVPIQNILENIENLITKSSKKGN